MPVLDALTMLITDRFYCRELAAANRQFTAEPAMITDLIVNSSRTTTLLWYTEYSKNIVIN